MVDRNLDVIKWIKHSVGTEKCAIDLGDSLEKGVGYLGDIIFAKVTLDKNEEELNIVLKVSKSLPGMRQLLEKYFKREIFFYNEIVPVLMQLQEEKNIVEHFQGFPNCYKAFCADDTEIIALENMNTRGYQMHDRKESINVHHLKLALKNYAKYHAISFALRDQKEDVFNKIDEKCPNLMKHIVKHFQDTLNTESKPKMINNLNEAGRKDLAEKYDKMIDDDIVKKLNNLIDDVPQEKVIVHGDSHLGNLLFKYKDSSKKYPTDMVIIDFQCVAMFSPMQDLSMLWYSSASKEEFSHFTELMEYYHNELSSFLTQLGSDVDNLFPVSKMWEHWNKYSLYSFILITSMLELYYAGDNAPNLSESNSDFLNFKISNRSSYLKRVVDAAEHYLTFQV